MAVRAEIRRLPSTRGIENGRTQVSRNGHPFNSFTDLRQQLTVSTPSAGKTVMDGEIVYLARDTNTGRHFSSVSANWIWINRLGTVRQFVHEERVS